MPGRRRPGQAPAPPAPERRPGGPSGGARSKWGCGGSRNVPLGVPMCFRKEFGIFRGLVRNAKGGRSTRQWVCMRRDMRQEMPPDGPRRAVPGGRPGVGQRTSPGGGTGGRRSPERRPGGAGPRPVSEPGARCCRGGAGRAFPVGPSSCAPPGLRGRLRPPDTPPRTPRALRVSSAAVLRYCGVWRRPGWDRARATTRPTVRAADGRQVSGMSALGDRRMLGEIPGDPGVSGSGSRPQSFARAKTWTREPTGTAPGGVLLTPGPDGHSSYRDQGGRTRRTVRGQGSTGDCSLDDLQSFRKNSAMFRESAGNGKRRSGDAGKGV